MTITVHDPATGQARGTFEEASEEDVVSAVAAARAALAGWRSMSVEDRGDHLRKVADVLESRAEAIGTIITGEMGRVRGESVPEVTKSAAFFRYFADKAPAVLAPTVLDLDGLVAPEKQGKIRHEPRGVVAMIKPWNAPVQQIVWGLVPALVAGCTVVVKPSEFTPESALELQRAFDDAGFPPGVMNTLIGGSEVGAALVDADVDMVAFTGSLATGRKVAETCGRRLRKCILELSGKDSLIVDPSVADLDLVSSGIVYGAFSNCGHWCSSVERVLLPRERADEILEAVVKKTAALRVGDGQVGGVDVGPVANRKQFDIVSSIVEDAIAQGATVLYGGKRLTVAGNDDGLFYEPTILRDVPDTARLASENVFGPVVAVEVFDSLDEAVARANETNYGLGLSFWTDDPTTADRIVAQSDTGMVWVNEPLQSVAACPWSVVKDSGIGVELGAEGIREFTYPKVVNAQFEGAPGPRPWYFPYT